MNWNPSDAQGRQGVGLVETVVAKLCHIFREQTTNDVGIDAHVELVESTNHEPTGQLVALQIKSGSSYFEEPTANGVIYRESDLKHLSYWLDHSLPVFLILVDTAGGKVYWQEITNLTVERLPKRGWKVEVPFTNNLEANFIAAARHRVGLEPASAIYTRLKLDDTSNGMTKRYAAHLLVRHPVTRLRLEAVVRRATTEIRRETFHRTARLGERFRDHEADVVSLYLAADPTDAPNANWLCRTMWVNPKLGGNSRPRSIGGIDLGEGLEVIWNSDYGDTSRFLKTLEIDKQSFLDDVQRFVAETERLVTMIFSTGNKCILDAATARQAVESMRRLYLDSTNIGLAPFECRDVAERFQDVMTFAENAFDAADPAMRNGNPDTANDYLLELALRDCRKHLERLRYEIEKVT